MGCSVSRAPGRPAGRRRRVSAVVVLPFTTIGGDSRILRTALPRRSRRELGHIDGTRVIAASSAFAYRGGVEDAERIGRELGANVMVRGSVQPAGERVRISAALLDGRDNDDVMEQSLRPRHGDILSVQDDIAWQVATKLAATVGAPAPPRPIETPRTTPAAYDAFLRGITIMRGNASRLRRGHCASSTRGRSRSRVSRWRERDWPAPIRSSSSTTPPTRSSNEKRLSRLRRRSRSIPIWRKRTCARAADVEPSQRVSARTRDCRSASRDRAEPNLADAHVELGKLYHHIGLIDQTIAANEEALRLDPGANVARNDRLVGAKIDGGMTEG